MAAVVYYAHMRYLCPLCPYSLFSIHKILTGSIVYLLFGFVYLCCEGHTFTFTYSYEGRVVDGRVVNTNTIGQSYPMENCISSGATFLTCGIHFTVHYVTDMYVIFCSIDDRFEIHISDFITSVKDEYYTNFYTF